MIVIADKERRGTKPSWPILKYTFYEVHDSKNRGELRLLSSEYRTLSTGGKTAGALSLPFNLHLVARFGIRKTIPPNPHQTLTTCAKLSTGTILHRYEAPSPRFY
jgi:hypothetical protein